MAEAETLNNMFDLLEDSRDISDIIHEIEERLYIQRKQCPYNIPYIKRLEQHLKRLRINQKHLKNRFDKVDGCF